MNKEPQILRHGDVFSPQISSRQVFLRLYDSTRGVTYSVFLATVNECISTTGTINMNKNCTIKEAFVHYNIFDVINNAEEKMKANDKTTPV